MELKLQAHLESDRVGHHPLNLKTYEQPSDGSWMMDDDGWTESFFPLGSSSRPNHDG